MRYSRDKHGESLAGFVSGYMQGMDDLPDGAWQACAEEAVGEFCKDFGVEIDPMDGFIEWTELTTDMEP